MVQVYTEALRLRHYAPGLSLAGPLRAVGLVAAIVLSWVIAHATGSLWLKTKVVYEQPAVKFMHDLVVVLDGAGPGERWFWSTFPELNDAMTDHLLAAEVGAAEEDLNQDGKVDRITLDVTAKGAKPVHAVKVLGQFKYSLSECGGLDMTGLAYVAEASGVPGAALSVDGALRLVQRDALSGGYRNVYQESVLHPGTVGGALQAGKTVNVGEVLAAYNDRNETTVLSGGYAVWEKGPGSEFKIRITVRVPSSEELVCKMSAIETLKFGWLQFLGTFVVLWFVLSWAEWALFHYRIVNTRVVSDVKAKVHSF